MKNKLSIICLLFTMMNLFGQDKLEFVIEEKVNYYPDSVSCVMRFSDFNTKEIKSLHELNSNNKMFNILEGEKIDNYAILVFPLNRYNNFKKIIHKYCDNRSSKTLQYYLSIDNKQLKKIVKRTKQRDNFKLYKVEQYDPFLYRSSEFMENKIGKNKVFNTKLKITYYLE